MKEIISKITPKPYVVLAVIFFLVVIIVYSVSVKKSVQIEIPNYFKFQAND